MTGEDSGEVLSIDDEKAARRIVPPITLGSTATDPAAPWIPDVVRRRVAAATNAGHAPHLYRAIGPRLDQHGYVADPACRTLGLRITTDDVDIAVAWSWRSDLKVPGWKLDGAWIAPGRPHEIEGAPYRLPIEKVGISVVDAALR